VRAKLPLPQVRELTLSTSVKFVRPVEQSLPRIIGTVAEQPQPIRPPDTPLAPTSDLTTAPLPSAITCAGLGTGPINSDQAMVVTNSTAGRTATGSDRKTQMHSGSEAQLEALRLDASRRKYRNGLYSARPLNSDDKPAGPFFRWYSSLRSHAANHVISHYL
jgi:hypothetical protein